MSRKPLRKRPPASYAEHKQRWRDCTRCGLCENRMNVVLARGVIPADVLLVGEGPGESENVLGKPFVGPAGRLLDQLVALAMEAAEADLRLLYSNLVCCIPKKSKGVREPAKDEIAACQPRLIELVQLAKPRIIVCVGSLSFNWVDKLLVSSYDGYDSLGITHPAAILRTSEPQRSLACQKCIATMAGAFATPF